MKLSVIIPTYNAEPYIKKLLEVLSFQTQKIDEIIVIDSSSSDGTVEIAKSFGARVVVIPKEKFDHGGTRTEAAKLAVGDILIYLTQDAIPVDRYSIKNIVKVFESEEIGAAYGRQVPYENTNLFGKHLRYFNYPDMSFTKSLKDKKILGFKIAFLSNSFAAYRKEVLKEIGWFKRGVIFGEDSIAAAKILLAGYKIVYSAEAKVFHSHSYSIWQDFKRYFDIGTFHKREKWILDTFGKPEGEGLRYIKSEFQFLINNNAYYLIPESLIRNFFKYFGYKLGFHYTRIPKGLRKKLSMFPSWWDKERRVKK